MMIRKPLAVAVGIAQLLIGASSILFTYLLHYDLFNIQTMLEMGMENTSLYEMLLLVFGLFSIISGLSFIQEWRSYV